MKVVVATYEHKHGMDVAVFASMELAEAWRESIAREYWDELDEQDRPEEFDADFYWDEMSNYGFEWFNYDWYEVQE